LGYYDIIIANLFTQTLRGAYKLALQGNRNHGEAESSTKLQPGDKQVCFLCCHQILHSFLHHLALELLSHYFCSNNKIYVLNNSENTIK
jgi:hypothetical protein